MAYTLNADGSVTLDSGETIAVTVRQEVLPNGIVAYHATAESGGIVSETTFTSDEANPLYARELLLAVLGEPAPADPLIRLSDEARRNVSIRQRLNIASAPPLDPASLL